MAPRGSVESKVALVILVLSWAMLIFVVLLMFSPLLRSLPEYGLFWMVSLLFTVGSPIVGIFTLAAVVKLYQKASTVVSFRVINVFASLLLGVWFVAWLTVYLWGTATCWYNPFEWGIVCESSLPSVMLDLFLPCTLVVFALALTLGYVAWKSGGQAVSFVLRHSSFILSELVGISLLDIVVIFNQFPQLFGGNGFPIVYIFAYLHYVITYLYFPELMINIMVVVLLAILVCIIMFHIQISNLRPIMKNTN